SLRKLREHLKSESPVELGGKVYSKEQLNEMASKVLAARESLKTQREGLKTAQDRLEKVATTLQSREDEGKAKLVTLRQQMDVIEAELKSLNAMKAAAAAAGSSDQALAVNFDEIEKKVTALHDKVKTETRFEDEKWKAAEAKKDVESVESII